MIVSITTRHTSAPFLFVALRAINMKYIVVAFLLSILLFDVVVGDGAKEQDRDKRSIEQAANRVRRALRAPHPGLINPADLGMRLSRRSDPFRRAPRMKRYRRMAEDPEMFKRGLSTGKHIRVKKANKA